MKRFWKQAEVSVDENGWGLTLDRKPLRTPGRNTLVVPTEALADAIAEEWNSAGETVEPREMPLTGLANAAIDRIAPDAEMFASELSKYGESDLTCYRADAPRELVSRQEQSWDPLLAWARRRFDVDFRTTSGIAHVPQPDATIQRLGHGVSSLDAFRLAGLSRLVTIGGSLIIALAVTEGAVTPEDAWEAVTIDERWQAEQWGADTEAEAALAARQKDFLAAARLLALLD